jgi:tetratricopeptide (TPR) repeat protein
MDLYENRRYEDATTRFQLLLQKYPKNPHFMIKIAYSLYYLNEISRVENWIQSTLDVDPRNYEAITLEGTLFHIRNQKDKAIEKYRNALNICPFFYVPLHNLGIIYAYRNLPVLAREYFHLAIEVNPKFELGWVSLGYTYFDNGKYNESKDYFEKSIQINPQFAPGWSALAEVAFKNSNYGDAERYYQKALECNPLIKLHQRYLEYYLKDQNLYRKIFTGFNSAEIVNQLLNDYPPILQLLNYLETNSLDPVQYDLCPWLIKYQELIEKWCESSPSLSQNQIKEILNDKSLIPLIHYKLWI